MNDRRVLIIGGGIAGVATAWFLTRRGISDVVVLEKESQCGVHSSGRNAAILRTWTLDPMLDRLALESADFLRRPPPGFCKTELIDSKGLLVLRATAPTSADELHRFEVRADVEKLDAERLSRLAPQFRIADASAFWFAEEGRIDIALLLDSFVHGARRCGAQLRFDQEVRSILVERGQVNGVELCDGRRIDGERVVIAAGGWAARLGERAGSAVRLQTTRRHLLQTVADPRVDPRGPVLWSDADGFYCRPEGGGWLMCPCDQSEIDPDHCTVDPEVIDAVHCKLRRLLPGFVDIGIARVWSGVRTLGPSGRFVLGADPSVRGLYWAAGLGGHGMTCSAAIGRSVADSIESDLSRGHGIRAQHGI